MSEHNHASSVQGSNRKLEEEFGWRKEVRCLRENIEKNKQSIRC